MIINHLYTVTYLSQNHAKAILLSQGEILIPHCQTVESPFWMAAGHCIESEWFYLKACIPVEWPLSLTGRVSCIFADHKNPPALYGAERPLFYGIKK